MNWRRFYVSYKAVVRFLTVRRGRYLQGFASSTDIYKPRNHVYWAYMMRETKLIRVLIVTSVRLWSDLIRVTCASQPDLTVVGSVTNKAQALAFRDRCDVMLVSHEVEDAVGLIKTSGLDMTPAVVMIGLPNVEPLILRYIEAGAAACIREQDSTEDLIRTIHYVATRRPVLSGKLPRWC